MNPPPLRGSLTRCARSARVIGRTVSHTGRMRKKMNLPKQFDHWVNDNNPPVHLQYGKGWWDYIEMLRRLASKFEIEQLEVVGTYTMRTPPPEEELQMPVVRLAAGTVELIVKYDFSTFPETWTASVKTSNAKPQPTYGLFDPAADLRGRTISGFDTGMIYGSYSENPAQFSCELEDEWDVAALIRIVSNGDG